MEKVAEQEFKSLTDDPERARWLSRNDLDGNLNLSMRGKELIEQYQSQTCSEPRQEVIEKVLTKLSKAISLSEEEILLYANEGK